ncbi:hypothetical protein KC343_g54 [Hortaea werneckii]|nr:hypothetical protein KC343_g54 [Hortaea werneckii]
MVRRAEDGGGGGEVARLATGCCFGKAQGALEEGLGRVHCCFETWGCCWVERVFLCLVVGWSGFENARAKKPEMGAFPPQRRLPRLDLEGGGKMRERTWTLDFVHLRAVSITAAGRGSLATTMSRLCALTRAYEWTTY